MKIKITRPCIFPDECGIDREHKIDDIVDVNEGIANKLITLNFAVEIKEEKAFESPPKDKMIHRAKKK